MAKISELTELSSADTGDFLAIVDTSTDTTKKIDVANLPAPTGVVFADGSVPLTADWDAGAFEIRAQTLESDVSTGTAPLTVASTTVVPNLNADLLDGQQGSYYQSAANINAGTLAHERGGLEADVSAYAGLVKISGGTTSQAVSNTDYAAAAHASRHVTGAADEIDGDKIDVDWNPANYTPTTSPSEADSVDNLTAHLAGIDAAIAAAASGLPQGYRYGLTLSQAADTDHDITVAVGSARGSANTADLVLSSAITKQIDATWAAGTAAGGMFSGSVANNTWYHLHLIRKDSDGSIDAGFDTSITAANIPSGYTAYRYLGSVVTNGSANIMAFAQRGRYFVWADPPEDWNSTNPGTSAVTRTISVPTGVECMAHVNTMLFSSTIATTAYISNLLANDEAAGITAAPLSQSFSTTTARGMDQVTVLTNTSSQIRTRLLGSDANTQFIGSTLFYENLGL